MPVDLKPIGSHSVTMKRKARTAVPMPEDLLRQVAAYAVADERTLVREIVALVREAIVAREADQ